MYYSGAPFAFKENKNVRSLLAYISKKGFSVGDKLPPERELAEQLGISRNSLREALKVLEAMDVVELRHGSGIFLRKEDTQPDDGSSLWLMIHKDEILNILTVREALDLKAIDLIPEEDYPRLRDEMKACIAAVRKTDMTNEDMLRHDLEFHNIIRRAANNDSLRTRMGRQEIGHPALTLFFAAFHINSRKRIKALRNDEVNLFRPLTPPIHAQILFGRPREKPCANRRFDQMAAQIGFTQISRFLNSRRCRHKRGVVYHETWRRFSAPHLFGIVFLNAAKHSRFIKQIEIMRNRHRVARILQLSKHLGIREFLR